MVWIESPTRSSEEVLLPVLRHSSTAQSKTKSFFFKVPVLQSSTKQLMKAPSATFPQPEVPKMTLGYDPPQDHGHKVFRPTGGRGKPSHGDYPGGFPCEKQRAVLTSLKHFSLGNPTAYCPIFRSFISETRNVQFLQPLEWPHVCRTHSGQTVATQTVVTPLFSRPPQP